MSPKIADIFKISVDAIKRGELISRPSKTDKEFHFQNWFKDRLVESGHNFDLNGRNSFPDFTLVAFTEGYEIKGLAYPGRISSFDSNSKVPSGIYNGRTIYYVFGRYPKNPDGESYPVIDLVVCHGDFLNADNNYEHENKHVSNFGVYGDILIRDRKMYVVPTPFNIADGLAHQHTLILPEDDTLGEDFELVGELERREVDKIVVGYSFDLRTNKIITHEIDNPTAGKTHRFKAWRTRGSPHSPVSIAQGPRVTSEEYDERNE